MCCTKIDSNFIIMSGIISDLKLFSDLLWITFSPHCIDTRARMSFQLLSKGSSKDAADYMFSLKRKCHVSGHRVLLKSKKTTFPLHATPSCQQIDLK